MRGTAIAIICLATACSSKNGDSSGTAGTAAAQAGTIAGIAAAGSAAAGGGAHDAAVDTGAHTQDAGGNDGGNGFGNNELEFYTARTDNAALDGNGQLVITARNESYMGRDYTSTRMKTAGLFEHTYGRYEARMRLPQGQGIWPAFWMLGNDIGSAGWPTCSEIDIMENTAPLSSRKC